MSNPERKVTHNTFTIERVFPHAPAIVFSAFATKDSKARWFGGVEDGWQNESWEMDFRPGGTETSIARAPNNGPRISFEARYYEILPNERLVYTYEMHIDGNRISVSLATIELRPDGPNGKGTRIVITEQGAYLDGFDNPKLREDGTNQLMDKLVRVLG